MNTIEKQVTQTYLDNLAYFQQMHPRLYQQLAALETSIDKGYHMPKYELEYQEGYFDVVESSSGTLLYGSNSSDLAQRAAKSISYKKNENVLETFFARTFSDEALAYYADENVETSAYHGLAPVMDYANRHAAPHNTTLRAIDKFIFLGVGLGLHLQTIDHKIHAKAYLIIEDDLELFRLSLFTCNYHALAQRANLHFWIFNDEEAHRIVADFLSDSFVENHYIKFFHLPSHHDIKFKTLQSIVASQEHLTFSYSALMNQYIKPLEHLRNGRPFLNIEQQWHHPLLTQTPVLLLAAGPSLKRHISWLKQHHTQFLIVAVSASLVLLEQEGIVPDIVIHIDGFDVSLAHFDRLQSNRFLQHSLTVFSASVLQEHVDRVHGKHCYFYQNLAQYKHRFGAIVGPCVGSQAVALLLRFGVENLYLLGLDLALDQQSGRTHTQEHLQSKTLDLSKHHEVEDTFTFASSTISVPGNFTEQVMTTSSFKMSIDTINRLIAKEKLPKQTLYNLNDGARLQQSTPLPVNSIPLEQWQPLDKSALQSELRALLTSYSECGLRDEERHTIEKMVRHAQKMRSIIDAYQAQSISSNIDTYKKRFIAFIDTLLAMEDGERYPLSIIYLYYLNNIVTYVFDILNTKELKNHKHHIKKVNKMVTSVVREIEEIYEKKITNFLK
ncbi:MAG: hypothetical protein DSZ03_04345 [Sulfurimonas sp.]|nr:MAG: hypothetical protein DSZ03_04345 [Sulfurimonas sp.]